MKYEYKVIGDMWLNKTKFQQDELNELGQDGWELVCTSTNTWFGFVVEQKHYFKRPLK